MASSEINNKIYNKNRRFYRVFLLLEFFRCNETGIIRRTKRNFPSRGIFAGLRVQSETYELQREIDVYTVSEVGFQASATGISEIPLFPLVTTTDPLALPFQSFQFWNWLSHLTCGETRLPPSTDPTRPLSLIGIGIEFGLGQNDVRSIGRSYGRSEEILSESFLRTCDIKFQSEILNTKRFYALNFVYIKFH